MSSDRFTEHYRLLSADPVMRAKLLADPNGVRTTLGSNALWQVALAVSTLL